jgi:rhamnose utilization protein RhaD (predicted bifunctional aldolase and dehydrogenase)
MISSHVENGSAEFAALRALSARIGADPRLVQAAGGNTSIKEDGVLWIKASGTWLAKATSDDIMVPVALDLLMQAIAEDEAAAEKATGFVLEARNPSGLRPSIETTVHAVMPHKVVVHVHCVETIAVAVRQDAAATLRERLDGMNWAHIPYVRPGLPLSRAIAERLKPDTDILILGNHGLVVAAETVAEAETLLKRVCGLLAQPVRIAPPPDREALIRLAGASEYRLPQDEGVHAAASDLTSCRIAAGGSLYPDHVIFLGPGSVIARPSETAAEIATAAADAGAHAPVSILFPGKGILMRSNATAGALALARCLSEVMARIPDGTPLRYLSDAENAALLNWDAEKYRQQLNRRVAPGRS